MGSERENIAERDGSEASVKRMRKLRERLLSSKASVRRQSAFNLSWLQEDGLEVLREVLYGDCSASVKNSVAYGLRRMRGRMKKMATEILREGLKGYDHTTCEVCRTALVMMGEQVPEKASSDEKKAGRLKINEIPKKRRSPAKAGLRRRRQ